MIVIIIYFQLEQQKQIKYQNHIFKGQTISFKTYYDDLENDPCCKEEISITHGDATDTICSSYEQQKEDTKTYTVSENGIYNISVKVQDDPTVGNDKLSNYKEWSESYTLAEELVCSNRPIITNLAVSESEEAGAAGGGGGGQFVPGDWNGADHSGEAGAGDHLYHQAQCLRRLCLPDG